MPLNIRPKADCRWDFLTLGEVMLRLDPGDRRVTTARHFDVWEGGGEYNVARGLKRCFGMDTAVVTAFADNAVGRLIEDLIYQGGVDQSLVKWVEYDGIGRSTRNGLNFTERGFGVRAAAGCSDRGHTAVSQLKAGDFDWDYIFGELGVRWFHTGGIFCALSPTTPGLALEAMRAAKRHGVIVSYDMNYRPSLWRAIGDVAQAQAVNRELAGLVDVMISNEDGFAAAMGLEIPHVDTARPDYKVARFKAMAECVTQDFEFKVVATTLREVHSASSNSFGGVCYCDGELYEAPYRENMEIHDRVGSGDSFDSGLFYGLLAGQSPQWSVECAAAHGALAMTTPGDTSMATLGEVMNLMKGGSARIAR